MAQVASGNGVVGGAESQGSGVSGAVAIDGREPDISRRSRNLVGIPGYPHLYPFVQVGFRFSRHPVLPLSCSREFYLRSNLPLVSLKPGLFGDSTAFS